MAHPETLNIAIIGAGIAGLTAAIALQKDPRVDVQIYERAQELREVGATIALGPNGLRTLERLGVTNALDDSIAFRNTSGSPMIYQHWKTNETISVDRHAGQVEDRHKTARFFRPHLQQALLEHVEPARLHLAKAFSSVVFDEAASNLILTFVDGTSTVVDLVLGADGIHSAVRRAFVPGTAAHWTGWTAFRSVFPLSHVAHIPDLPDEAVHYWGPDRTLFLSRLGRRGELFAVVASAQSDPETPDAPYGTSLWNEDGDVEVLREFYKDWHPTLRAVIDATPHVRVFPNTAARALDTWVLGGHGRVTLAGDAAHAHGGAFAAGGSLAIDDAWAFAAAVKHFLDGGGSSAAGNGDAGVRKAVELYEQTRKKHTDRVQRTVETKNTGVLERLRKGREETDEELRFRMRNRADLAWVHEHDVQTAFGEAVASLEHKYRHRSRM